MKKIMTFLIVLSPYLFGDIDGYEVYKSNCVSCHAENISKNEFIKNISTMKAPPMIEVANQLKSNILIKNDNEDVHRQVIILFIKNYIDNPDFDYSLCHPGALGRFGVMPSLKGKLSEVQKQAVAEWIYDRFEGVEFK